MAGKFRTAFFSFASAITSGVHACSLLGICPLSSHCTQTRLWSGGMLFAVDPERYSSSTHVLTGFVPPLAGSTHVRFGWCRQPAASTRCLIRGARLEVVPRDV